MKKILWVILFLIALIPTTLPSLIGCIALLGDLKYYGITETCNICIKTLYLISEKTGYSYEFLNVVLFILIEPIIIIISTILAFLDSKRIKYSILSCLIIIEICLFNYISEYYVLCSKFCKIMLNLQ